MSVSKPPSNRYFDTEKLFSKLRRVEESRKGNSGSKPDNRRSGQAPETPASKSHGTPAAKAPETPAPESHGAPAGKDAESSQGNRRSKQAENLDNQNFGPLESNQGAKTADDGIIEGDPTTQKNLNIVQINKLLETIDESEMEGFMKQFLDRLTWSGAFDPKAGVNGQIVDSQKALQILKEMIQERKRQKVLEAFQRLDLGQLENFSNLLGELDTNLSILDSSLAQYNYDDIIKILRLKFAELCRHYDHDPNIQNKINKIKDYLESLNSDNPLYQIRSQINQILTLLQERNMSSEINNINSVAHDYYLCMEQNRDTAHLTNLRDYIIPEAQNFLNHFDNLLKLEINDPHATQNGLAKTMGDIDNFIKSLQEIQENAYDNPSVREIVQRMIDELESLTSYLHSVQINYQNFLTNWYDVGSFQTLGTTYTRGGTTITETIQALIDLLSMEE